MSREEGSASAVEVPRRKSRVLIVDGEAIICEALAQLISRAPNLTVVGALTDGRGLLTAARRSTPDLVLLDLMVADCDGLELIKEFKAVFPAVPVLVLCGNGESTHAERSVRAGAAGYVMKREGALDLFAAIETVLGGNVHLSQRMSAILLGKLLGPARQATPGNDGSQLTDRELRVFELIGAGQGTREIATRLCRSVKTIEAHRANIKTKLHLRTAAQLTERAAA